MYWVIWNDSCSRNDQDYHRSVSSVNNTTTADMSLLPFNCTLIVEIVFEIISHASSFTAVPITSHLSKIVKSTILSLYCSWAPVSKYNFNHHYSNNQQNWIWGKLNNPEIQIIPRNSQYREPEGFRTRSNFGGLKLWFNKRYALQNIPRDILHTYMYMFIIKFIFQTKSLQILTLISIFSWSSRRLNCQLIQCTHITDLLSNFQGLVDFMIIKVFIVMQNASSPQMC